MTGVGCGRKGGHFNRERVLSPGLGRQLCSQGTMLPAVNFINYKHVYFIMCSGKQYFQPQQTEQNKKTAISVPLPRDVRYVESGISFQAQAGLVRACVSSTRVSFDTLQPRDCPWTTGPREHLGMGRVRGPVGFSLVLGNSPPCCSGQKPQ